MPVVADDREADGAEDARAGRLGVEEAIAHVERAVAVLVGLDHELGQLRARRAAAEGDLEPIADDVLAAGVLEVDGADLDGRGGQQLPRFHLLEAAPPHRAGRGRGRGRRPGLLAPAAPTQCS